MQLLECVPNISEGRNHAVLSRISDSISSVSGVHILHKDVGISANRTVLTIVGPPQELMEAMFRAIETSCKLIDMRIHSGEHPRMGAIDVCPFIPIQNISVEEANKHVDQLGERVGQQLNIPVYLYEKSARKDKRRNLANIRAGEYEGFREKILKVDWKPDYGPQQFNAKFGQMAIGVRKFLVAYNINLNTIDSKIAHQVACDVRESGRIRKGGTLRNLENFHDSFLTSPITKRVRHKGSRKSLKAIGWFMEEFKLAQVSMNLVNLDDTDLHEAFEAVDRAAKQRGLRVTGSELIGMVPLKSLTNAASYFLKKQRSYVSYSESQLIDIARNSLGLSALKPFHPQEKILEYKLQSLGII